MPTNDSIINPAANDQNTTQTSMMDLWQASIERARQKRTQVAGTAKDEQEARADLEQRIRNGQEQCPTCASRTYADDSDDGGVSFQSPRHIAASTSGAAVMSHEREHVTANDAKARREDRQVTGNTVALEYARCPQCGRTYVAGGVTKTTTRSLTAQNKPPRTGILDAEA